MTVPIPVKAEARTSVEIVNSCNHCCPCWPQKKKHSKKPSKQAEAKTIEVAKDALEKPVRINPV